MIRPSGRCSLVVPGRNAARTLRPCLEAASAILAAGSLSEILYVDDGSTDASAEIARVYPVRCLASGGRGPGAARNAGWRATASELVWFIDSDCVAEPNALDLLLAHLGEPEVAGAGGSYSIAPGEPLLACLIHEEIRQRHLAMPEEVDFLGGFNVVYRRDVLERVGGFDESRFNGPGAPGAEDADLSFRISAAGYRLRFEPRSHVRHFHPTRLSRYMRAQRLHGFWALRLYLRHPRRGARNAYSGLLDHAQPALGLLLLPAVAGLAFPPTRWIPAALAGLLLLAQLPMTLGLLARLRQPRYLAFAPLSMARAIARGLGMAEGALSLLWTGLRPPAR